MFVFQTKFRALHLQTPVLRKKRKNGGDFSAAEGETCLGFPPSVYLLAAPPQKTEWLPPSGGVLLGGAHRPQPQPGRSRT